MTEQIETDELTASPLQSGVSLTCECGAKFSRQQVPERLKEKTFFKWQFRYCDVCFRARADQAFKRMPEMLKALAEAN